MSRKRRTRRDELGRLRCCKDGKLIYPSRAAADVALVEHARNPAMDPGAEAYWCRAAGAFHVGHRGGWRSLQRVIEMAGGT